MSINHVGLKKELRDIFLYKKENQPFIDLLLMCSSDGCEEALELGVVDTVDMGELGFIMSLIGVVFPPWFFISSFTLLLLLLALL